MARLRTKTISRRTVEAFKVEKDTMFWDSELAGFGVRVYPSGMKVYIAQTRARGKAAQRVTVGEHGVITPEEARRRAGLILLRIKAGQEPVPEPLAATLASGPTVGDLARHYLEDHVAVRCKAKTEENYRQAIAKHIAPALGRLPALAVDHARVTELHHALRDTPAMANRVVDTLSRIYNAGRGQGPDPGREQSVPAGDAEPREEARAVPDARRAEAARAGAGGRGPGPAGLGVLGGGDPAADPNGLPQAGDPAPALGAGGPRRGRASPARHQDGSEDGPAVAGGGAGAGAGAAPAGQPLGDSGQGRGPADAQHRRDVVGGVQGGRDRGHPHPRLPSQLRVPGRWRSA